MLGHGALGQSPLGGVTDLPLPLRGTDGSRYTREIERERYKARLREQRRRYEAKLAREEEERRVAAAAIAAETEAELVGLVAMLEDVGRIERARILRDEEEAAFLLMVA